MEVSIIQPNKTFEMLLTFEMLVASDPNGVIGKDNTLPWRIPEDMKWFKEKTTNGIVIMGRKTWESLPKSYLPNRINLVLSKTPDKIAAEVKEGDSDSVFGPFFLEDIEDITHFCNEVVGHTVPRFVIGGEAIYNLFLNEDLIDCIWLSKVKDCYDGDTFMPALDKKKWHEEEYKDYEKFTIIKMTRNKNGN